MSIRFSSMRKMRMKAKQNPQIYSQTIDVVQSPLQKQLKKKHAQFFLPPLQLPHNNEEVIRLKNEIVDTVRKLQDKIFIPHNASKKKNLQLIKRRRGSEFKIQKATRSFSFQQNTLDSSRKFRQISLQEKMNNNYSQRNQISSCSLQDTIFYG